MFTVGKTTFDMAHRRGLELTVENGCTDDGSTLLCFWERGEESEWIFSYRFDDSGLVWHGNVYAKSILVKSMPEIIHDETELRTVVRLLGSKRLNKWLIKS
ncbi:hypothetical protein [Klebsiella sp. HN106]|uniref:hypothetical protein n=1 Tax=Klebsiella sp. HN106 TaxID=3401058 RepID=UPI003EC084B9